MRTDSTHSLRSASWLPSRRPELGGGAVFGAHLRPPIASQASGLGDVTRLGPIGLSSVLDDGEERAERRRRVLQRGHGMLGLLGSLQRLTASGDAVPVDVLDRLATSLEGLLPIEDPELGQLLQDIETRVRVELARRGR